MVGTEAAVDLPVASRSKDSPRRHEEHEERPSGRKNTERAIVIAKEATAATADHPMASGSKDPPRSHEEHEEDHSEGRIKRLNHGEQGEHREATEKESATV
jgi:hypothetical protein